MIWARFPHGVMYRGEYYAAGTDIPVADDNLAKIEEKGGKIVRAEYEPKPEEPKAEPAKRVASSKPAEPAKRRGRKPKNA